MKARISHCLGFLYPCGPSLSRLPIGAAFIRINYQKELGNNFGYKDFRFTGIRGETKCQVHGCPRKVWNLYPNLAFTTKDTVNWPRRVIVSEVIALKF